MPQPPRALDSNGPDSAAGDHIERLHSQPSARSSSRLSRVAAAAG